MVADADGLARAGAIVADDDGPGDGSARVGAASAMKAFAATAMAYNLRGSMSGSSSS